MTEAFDAESKLARVNWREVAHQLSSLLPDDAFFIKDAQGRIILQNRRAYEYCNARDEAATRRCLHAWKHSWPVAAGVRLWRARGSARHRWSDALPRLAETAARAGDRIFDPPPLLTGDELRAETGLPAGPEVGRLLAALRDAQITGEISTPREAREWLRRRPPGS